MEGLCERLTSKEPMPLHRWAHVGLVSEGAKLRLYLNGSLDTARHHASAPAHRSHFAKHPLYVGKVPGGGSRLPTA